MTSRARTVFSVWTPVAPSLSFWLSSCESCLLHCWGLTGDFASYLLPLHWTTLERLHVNAILLVILSLPFLDSCPIDAAEGLFLIPALILFLFHLGATGFAALFLPSLSWMTLSKKLHSAFSSIFPFSTNHPGGPPKTYWSTQPVFLSPATM